MKKELEILKQMINSINNITPEALREIIDELQINRVDNNKCPYCGSDNIFEGAFYIEDCESGYQECQCNECEKTWDDWFKMEYDGFTTHHGIDYNANNEII